MTPAARAALPLTVRPATDGDVAAIVHLAGRFVQTHYPMLRHSPEALTALTEALVMQGGVWVLTTVTGVVVGAVGMAVGPLPTSGEPVGVEVMWWVEPEYRGTRAALRLLETAERAAVDAEVAVLHLTEPATGSEGLAAVYRRRGYAPLETTWQKRVAHGG